MKCKLKTNENQAVLNVGDIFITKKGNPHMVIKNLLDPVKSLQVLKLSGMQQARIIKRFSSMNDLLANYDIAEVIKSRDIVLNKR